MQKSKSMAQDEIMKNDEDYIEILNEYINSQGYPHILTKPMNKKHLHKRDWLLNL